MKFSNRFIEIVVYLCAIVLLLSPLPLIARSRFKRVGQKRLPIITLSNLTNAFLNFDRGNS